MTMKELAERLDSWTDSHGWDMESLNDFVNINATSYEEYNTIWEILNDYMATAGCVSPLES